MLEKFNKFIYSSFELLPPFSNQSASALNVDRLTWQSGASKLVNNHHHCLASSLIIQLSETKKYQHFKILSFCWFHCSVLFRQPIEDLRLSFVWTPQLWNGAFYCTIQILCILVIFHFVKNFVLKTRCEQPRHRIRSAIITCLCTSYFSSPIKRRHMELLLISGGLQCCCWTLTFARPLHESEKDSPLVRLELPHLSSAEGVLSCRVDTKVCLKSRCHCKINLVMSKPLVA